jgi:SAM-dependent methyltransferase
MTTLQTPRTANDGSKLRALVAATPWLGPAARALARTPVIEEIRRRFAFRNSTSYWERRYQNGRTSGVGSYGRLANFKAEILNDFVERNGIQSVAEFGCGDGTQLSLARYPRYVGFDIAAGSVAICQKRFADDHNKSFLLTSEIPKDIGKFDLALSLDVIYHLVEDEVFNAYMRTLLEHAGRFMAIYSSNKVEPSGVPHIRHRRFTDWINVHAPQWKQSGFVANRYPLDPKRPDNTSFADFYFFELTT